MICSGPGTICRPLFLGENDFCLCVRVTLRYISLIYPDSESIYRPLFLAENNFCICVGDTLWYNCNISLIYPDPEFINRPLFLGENDFNIHVCVILRYISLIYPDPESIYRPLFRLRENFVIVPADKASNNYTFVCKRYYVDILIEELGLHLLPGNSTYTLTNFSASEVLDNHKSVLTTFGIQTADEELDLPYIYWIQKMHKNPYKHRFIAGSLKCSTKPLSILLTKLLTHIKQGLQKYCETAYSRSGVNQMWILKNSKELL